MASSAPHPGFATGLSVAGSIPTGGKLFAEINLPFTTKQYKNDKIVNFVHYGKTRMC